MATLLLALWCAGPAVKAAAAYRLWRNGLWRRYPTLWAYIAVSLLNSILLISFRNERVLYSAIYAYATPIILLLESFAIVGVFWILTEYYPRFRGPGSALLTALALIGVVAGWITRFTAVPETWSGLWEIALLFQRYVTLVMGIVLIGGRVLLPRVRGIPIRASAARATDILVFHVVACSAGTFFTVATAAHYPMVTAFVPVLAGLVTATLFAFWLTPESDQSEEAELAADPEIEKFLARHQRIWQLLRQPAASHVKPVE